MNDQYTAIFNAVKSNLPSEGQFLDTFERAVREAVEQEIRGLSDRIESVFSGLAAQIEVSIKDAIQTALPK